jgi:hypothetical protein
MAVEEEVWTTRSTEAREAARITFSVPSRAGTIRSSGCLGMLEGIGEATCSYVAHAFQRRPSPSYRLAPIKSRPAVAAQGPGNFPSAASPIGDWEHTVEVS